MLLRVRAGRARDDPRAARLESLGHRSDVAPFFNGGEGGTSQVAAEASRTSMIRVCLAGATGWAGSALARGIARSADVSIVAAVARRDAGRSLGDVLGEPRLTAPIHSTAADALATACDVFVEYTKPAVAKANVLTALER